MIHSEINDCSHHHDYYLVTLRDPVDRLQSWYKYEEDILIRLRENCPFDTLNDLAHKGLLGDGSNDTSPKCRAWARRAIRGEEQFGYHAFHNFAYHIRQVPSNASVAVIRLEHMAEDWNAMEALLGSSTRVETFPVKNRGQKSTRLLSDLARSTICKHLCDEIQVYKSILNRAANLQRHDVEVSMLELRNSCPREASMPACPI
jgi:hypothetical protein